MKKLIALIFFPLITSADNCFKQTYCATGEAPKFILCNRGQDCSKAVDLGIKFEKDCTVSWWLGDAQEMRKYTVNKSRITILPRDPLSEKAQRYSLSKDRKKITSQDESKYIYNINACVSGSKN